MAARAFHRHFLLHDNADPDLCTVAAWKTRLPGWGFIASNYYRVLCTLLRIHVRVSGAPVRDRAVLFVSNHVSWVDIVVVGSITPVAFVAKREVASWPLVGVTAKMQRTVFVDRGAVIRPAMQSAKSSSG